MVRPLLLLPPPAGTTRYIYLVFNGKHSNNSINISRSGAKMRKPWVDVPGRMIQSHRLAARGVGGTQAPPLAFTVRETITAQQLTSRCYGMFKWIAKD
eukprot:1124338-Pelagomonas_calceolata.AAC.10